MGKELIKFVIRPYVGDREIEFVDSIQDGVSPLTLDKFIEQCESSGADTLLPPARNGC